MSNVPKHRFLPLVEGSYADRVEAYEVFQELWVGWSKLPQSRLADLVKKNPRRFASVKHIQYNYFQKRLTELITEPCPNPRRYPLPAVLLAPLAPTQPAKLPEPEVEILSSSSGSPDPDPVGEPSEPGSLKRKRTKNQSQKKNKGKGKALPPSMEIISDDDDDSPIKKDREFVIPSPIELRTIGDDGNVKGVTKQLLETICNLSPENIASIGHRNFRDDAVSTPWEIQDERSQLQFAIQNQVRDDFIRILVEYRVYTEYQSMGTRNKKNFREEWGQLMMKNPVKDRVAWNTWHRKLTILHKIMLKTDRGIIVAVDKTTLDKFHQINEDEIDKLHECWERLSEGYYLPVNAIQTEVLYRFNTISFDDYNIQLQEILDELKSFDRFVVAPEDNLDGETLMELSRLEDGGEEEI